MSSNARLCCIQCTGRVSLTLAAADHTVTDATGRTWTFEQHPMFGPVILRKDGNPKSRQPGSRSPFWPAWEAWNEVRQWEQRIERGEPRYSDGPLPETGWD
ncbi:MAG: hypothetical protein O9341_18040 [Paucibacter sp.]|nr:hypothetical protein [Roseateles sp.]